MCVSGLNVEAQDETEDKVIEKDQQVRLTEVFGHEIEEYSNFPDLGESYEVLKQIGTGAMGDVYKIRSLETREILAAKVLKKELAIDEHALKRFEAEAKTIIDISHKNIVTTHHCSRSSGGLPFIVMDFIEGKTLSEIIQQGQIDSEKANVIALQLCDALEAIHAQKIIHRDLKPSNIMIDECGIVKLLDFGIARLQTDVRATQSLTKTRDIVGSPAYMSPEQCLGMALDERSDIYSLGCILYELFSGKPVFKGENSIDYVIQHLNETPPNLGSYWKRNLIGVAVMVCLNKSPEERCQSVGKVKELLVNSKNTGFRIITKQELLSGFHCASRLYSGLGTWILVYFLFVVFFLGPFEIKTELPHFVSNVLLFSGITAAIFTLRYLYLKERIKIGGSSLRKREVSKNWSLFHAVSCLGIMAIVIIGPQIDISLGVSHPPNAPDEILFISLFPLFFIALLCQAMVLGKHPEKFNI